ncbi:MAG: hypothetical protein Q9199_006318 [Rusavskia elegans]
MFSLQTVLSCLYFALFVVAPLPPPASPGTDPCGPFNHQGDAAFNTCFSSIAPGAGPYGIVCGSDTAVTRTITLDQCAKSAAEMCMRVALGTLTTGEWHWTGDLHGSPCRVGVYLSTDIAGAPVPNYRRCLNQIYQPLVLSCIKPPYNVGTVNLKQLPNVTNIFQGETFNPAYPAYVVSPMALYHSVDPPATANVFGNPATGFSQNDIKRQQFLQAKADNATQTNEQAVNEAGGAGAEDRGQA